MPDPEGCKGGTTLPEIGLSLKGSSTYKLTQDLWKHEPGTGLRST